LILQISQTFITGRPGALVIVIELVGRAWGSADLGIVYASAVAILIASAAHPVVIGA